MTLLVGITVVGLLLALGLVLTAWGWPNMLFSIPAIVIAVVFAIWLLAGGNRAIAQAFTPTPVVAQPPDQTAPTAVPAPQPTAVRPAPTAVPQPTAVPATNEPPVTGSLNPLDIIQPAQPTAMPSGVCVARDGGLTAYPPGHPAVTVPGPAVISVWRPATPGVEYVFPIGVGESYPFGTDRAGQVWTYNPTNCSAAQIENEAKLHAVRLHAERGGKLNVRFERPNY